MCVKKTTKDEDKTTNTMCYCICFGEERFGKGIVNLYYQTLCVCVCKKGRESISTVCLYVGAYVYIYIYICICFCVCMCVCMVTFFIHSLCETGRLLCSKTCQVSCSSSSPSFPNTSTTQTFFEATTTLSTISIIK